MKDKSIAFLITGLFITFSFSYIILMEGFNLYDIFHKYYEGMSSLFSIPLIVVGYCTNFFGLIYGIYIIIKKNNLKNYFIYTSSFIYFVLFIIYLIRKNYYFTSSLMIISVRPVPFIYLLTIILPIVLKIISKKKSR